MYQVYKLVRMINATYPNNGFINALDVDVNTEISEDLIDVINEALHESYKEVELDEVYSFRTIPNQAEYSLPIDCDMSQIQEVTRSMPYPHGECHHRKHIKDIEEIVEGEKTEEEKKRLAILQKSVGEKAKDISKILDFQGSSVLNI